MRINVTFKGLNVSKLQPPRTLLITGVDFVLTVEK